MVLSGNFLHEYWFYLIDVVVLLGILIWAARRAVPAFVQERRDRIVKDIEEAQRMRQEAESKLAEYEDRLAHLEEEIARILAEARKAGEEERERILEDARRASERIRKDATARLEQESARIANDMRLQLVHASMAEAETAVASRLTDAHERRFVGEYIADLEKRRLDDGSGRATTTPETETA